MGNDWNFNQLSTALQEPHRKMRDIKSHLRLLAMNAAVRNKKARQITHIFHLKQHKSQFQTDQETDQAQLEDCGILIGIAGPSPSILGIMGSPHVTLFQISKSFAVPATS